MHYNKQGYLIDVNSNGKNQEIHRSVVERYLGRKLKLDETVHHIDEDKENNCITNLAVFETRGGHLRYHALLKTRNLNFPKSWGKNKNLETANNILYQKYGIVFYGPFHKKKIQKRTNEFAEMMKRDLGLRETGALYSCI